MNKDNLNKAFEFGSVKGFNASVLFIYLVSRPKFSFSSIAPSPLYLIHCSERGRSPMIINKT